MKNEGKDVTEMNAEIKEAAIRLLENLWRLSTNTHSQIKTKPPWVT